VRTGRDPVGAEWEGKAQELFVGLREWRELHPRASLAEIEAELDRQLSRMRARMLADLALASRAAEVGRVGPAERPRCGACGGKLVSEGTRRRTLQTVNDQTVTLERDYASCTACGGRFFPPR
jgi:YgiT-type zinc finger domain-containing protein